MKIKEFLGEKPIEAVKADPEQAGRLLAESLGWTVWHDPQLNEYCFNSASFDEDEWQCCYALAKNLDSVSGGEKAVIGRYGYEDYGRFLVGVSGFHGIGLDSLARLATVPASVRLAACLLSLSELEK
jgi:hypothetical protein